jgi:putative salt-induced outer membrane protein
MTQPVAALAELPEPVRAMIDAAIATGDEGKVRVVIEIARATNRGTGEGAADPFCRIVRELER